jgi:hypothetical protein
MSVRRSPTRAFEQLFSQRILKGSDLRAERGLGQQEPLSRLAP